MKFLENRIPPPLVALLIGLGMWAWSSCVPGIAVEASARVAVTAVFVLIGIFFCLAGVISFRRAKTTVNPLKPETASSLVSSGIYQYSRNPMYVGFALLLNALAVYLASPWALLGIPAFVLFINRFQIAPEERALEAIFGADFLTYKSRVRKWL